MSSTVNHHVGLAAAAGLAATRRLQHGVGVPLDGSSMAEEALAVGASLARRAGVPLHLISVTEPTLTSVLREFPDRAADEAQEERIHRQAYLERVADAVRAVRPGVVRVAVLSGHTGEAIAAYAARERLDLIVLTTRGRGRLAQWSLGSVGTTLLQRSDTPLLLLHRSELPRLGEFRRFVVGLDGEQDHLVLEAALRLGSLSPGARYVLVSVVEPAIPLLTPLAMHPHHKGTRWQASRVADAEARLSGLARGLEAQGVTVSWEAIKRRGVSRAIREIAQSVRSDCLVVGTHGLSGVDRIVLGSVAGKILRDTDLPTLVVPLREV